MSGRARAFHSPVAAKLVVVRRMPLSAAIPTPGEPDFPADPITVLRYGWPYLLVYYIEAAIIVFLLARRLGIARFSRSHRERAIAAVILAAIFAPGEVTDFFLFILPGPAVVGLLCLLLGWALTVIARPAALLDAHFYERMVGIIGGFYILPLLLTFYIAYGALFLYARFCGHTTRNA